MNNKQSLQPNPTIFGIGMIIGLALGLFIGWVLWPVEWEGITLRDLDSATKAEYVAAVADAFAIYDDPDAATVARQRLAPLDGALDAEFPAAVAYLQSSNQPERNIRISNIRRLANALGIVLPNPGIAVTDATGENSVQLPPTDGAVGQSGTTFDTQPSTGNTAVTGTDEGATGSSWLRSLLWLLAILLIVGGALFLVSASGLINWQAWISRWAGLSSTGEQRERTEWNQGGVDEFEPRPYQGGAFDDEPFETGNEHSGSYTQIIPFEQGSERNDLPEADSLASQRYREPFDTDDTAGTYNVDTYSFADEESSDEGQPSQPLGEWRYSHERGKQPAPHYGEDADDVPNMFADSDFPEADDEEDADDAMGYRTAYAGGRYSDESDGILRSQETLRENVDEDNVDGEITENGDDTAYDEDYSEDDEEYGDYIDDTAPAGWRPPTVDSVLADKNAASTDEQEITNTEHGDLSEDDNRQPPQDLPAASPFAKLTGRHRQTISRFTSTNDQQQAKSHDQTSHRQPAQRKQESDPSGAPKRSSTTPASRPQQSPGHTASAQYRVIDQYTLQYQLGIQEYDESKPIVDPTSGKYIGEFGMGASVKNALVQSNPEHVAALEVWLFDKSDETNIGNKTRILLSEYAVDNNLDKVFLKERQDDPRPFTAQRGVHFQLESKNLLLDCMIVDVEYIDSGNSEGMFQRVKIDMSVHQKN